MAAFAKHHCFALPLDHVPFPDGLPFQVAQFTHMVDLHLALFCPTPFALIREQSFSQFRSASVDHRVWQ